MSELQLARLIPALLVGTILAVLAFCLVYEIAFALGALDVGPLPGQGPPGHGVVLPAALLAMAAGSITCAFSAASGRSQALVALLTPLAATFATARFFTFDPYYAPGARRFSEGGIVSEGWMIGLVAAALATGLAMRFYPSFGKPLGTLMLIVTAVTVVVQGAGH